MRFVYISLLLFLLTSDGAIGNEHACTPSERWSDLKGVPEEAAKDFRDTLSGKISPARGFSEALALRKKAMTPEIRTFSEYWMSRALYNAELFHISFRGLAVIASRPVPISARPYQIATLQCLARIHDRYPTIAYPDSVISTALSLRTPEPIYGILRQFIAEGRPSRDVLAVLESLKGSGAWEDAGHALWSAHSGRHTETIKRLNRHFSDPNPPRPIAKHADHFRLLIARAHYSIGDFESAKKHYQAVAKSSNELARALSELSWTFLADNRLPDAIGTSLSLHTGNLRRTFTPEAPMVMAMALNELCQYPKSVEAIQLFRKNYGKSYDWLRENLNQEPYPVLVNYLKKQPISAPEAVVSEWVRSPLFFSRQDQLNLLNLEERRAKTLGNNADQEQRQSATRLLKFTQDLKKRYQLARVRMKPGESLPPQVLTDLQKLYEDYTRFQRFRQAAPVWISVLKNHERIRPGLQKRILSDINTDLMRMNLRMLTQLEEIAENNQLIEIEIYNGASQDIIWQNANPEYRKIASQIAAEKKRDTASKVWNWGSALAHLDGSGEIWEDELGSFKADLFDNCSNKERYLALKNQIRGGGKR